MARKNVADAAKAKAAKQKKIAIGLVVLLAAAGAYAVHTMMALNGGASSKPQVAAVGTTGATATPAPAPTSALPAAPTSAVRSPTDATTTASTGSTQLIDAGARHPQTPGSCSRSRSSRARIRSPRAARARRAPVRSPRRPRAAAARTTSKPPKTPPAPPTAPPTSAVISVNGTSESVATGSNFPVANPVFQLMALTASTAKVAVVGGSYASGALDADPEGEHAGHAREHRRRHALHAHAAAPGHRGERAGIVSVVVQHDADDDHRRLGSSGV